MTAHPGSYPGQAHPLRARVVLVHDRSPPLDHATLDLGSARCRSMDHGAQRRHVVTGTDLVGQLEHPDEHGGDELGVGDSVLLNQPQALLGIEALHHDDRPPHPLHRRRPHQRCRVVERRRAQVDVALGEAHDALEHGGERGVGAEGLAAQGAPHTLRMARGARGVEHREALHLVGRAARRGRTDEIVVATCPSGTSASW